MVAVPVGTDEKPWNLLAEAWPCSQGPRFHPCSCMQTRLSQGPSPCMAISITASVPGVLQGRRLSDLSTFYPTW